MRLSALARLTRFEHGLLLSLAAAIGMIVASGGVPAYSFLLLAILPPFFIELASFAMNDLLDVKSDTINKRTDRPLVTGEATRRDALIIAILGFLAGNAIAYLISINAFLIALAFSILAIAYNKWLKDVALIGNAYIGVTMAIPFAYGAITTNPDAIITGDVWMLCAIAFTVGLGREIMKTVQDMEGDRKARASRSLPFIIGPKNSILLACGLYVLAVVFSYIPALVPTSIYYGSLIYLVPIAATDVLLLYVAVSALTKGEQFMKQARSLSLLALGIGLIGFLSGALF